ncbi:C-type lectin domain family 2 member D-like, partial [Neopelma chrysocephalum]|uniref:C-type lectin domain family 2 member D-like n=1 Tax=Neopelma chrysocephalum TaxID=114329 RepID=UPI000FCD312E
RTPEPPEGPLDGPGWGSGWTEGPAQEGKAEGRGARAILTLLFPAPGSYRPELVWRIYTRFRALLALCVSLGIFSLILLVAVIVLGARPQFLEPEFSHVCPDTWPGFQGKCYYFSVAEGNWSTGRERCEALGASLASISTGDELNFLLRHKGEANHWIGLE